jgi:hypothetical protein
VTAPNPFPKKLMPSPGCAGRKAIGEALVVDGRTYVKVLFTMATRYGLPLTVSPWHKPHGRNVVLRLLRPGNIGPKERGDHEEAGRPQA